jgi:hypothetical protein
MMTREERAEIRARVYRMGKATTQDAQLLLDSHDEADRVIEQLREELASVLGAQVKAALAAGRRPSDARADQVPCLRAVH